MKYAVVIIGFVFFISCNTKRVTTSNPLSDITYIKKPANSASKSPLVKKEKAPKLKKETVATAKKRPYYYAVLIDRFKSKKEADHLLNEFKNRFPLLPAKIRYEVPYYKVYTGIYNSEEEADKAAKNLRSKYTSAFSVRFRN